jgi:hypothetical protein
MLPGHQMVGAEKHTHLIVVAQNIHLFALLRRMQIDNTVLKSKVEGHYVREIVFVGHAYIANITFIDDFLNPVGVLVKSL